jgi:translation elongation factor EF-Tu-like GTPase
MTEPKKSISNVLFNAAQQIFVILYESSVDCSKPKTSPKMLLSRSEAAEILSVSVGTIDNWRKSERLKAVYPFGKDGEARYTAKAIERMVKQLELESELK